MDMRLGAKFALLVIGILVLASCSATDCDPSKGGLIDGIRCSASGGYDNRIKQREDEHASLLSRKAELTREQQKVQAEQKQATSQVRKMQAEQKKARANLAAVEAQLAGARKDDAALQQQAKDLEGEIALTAKDMDGMAQAEQARRKRLGELQAEQKALDAEYKAATGVR